MTSVGAHRENKPVPEHSDPEDDVDDPDSWEEKSSSPTLDDEEEDDDDDEDDYDVNDDDDDEDYIVKGRKRAHRFLFLLKLMLNNFKKSLSNPCFL